MALKKPSDLLGIKKVSEIVEKVNKIDESTVGGEDSESSNLSVSFSASLIDEVFKNLQQKIQNAHKEDILNVYEELSKCKKLVNTTELRVENRISSLKKELYERIDEHIVTAQQTIQELYQSEIRQIKKLSTDINLVEKYVSKHSEDIVRLRTQIFEELKKKPVIIERLEDKIEQVSQSYQLLSEGLLNEPPSSDSTDPLSNRDFVTTNQLKDHYRLFLSRIEEQLSTIGGGGETQLKYLDDIVGIATNASSYDGKYLKYNHSLKKFEFTDIDITSDSWVEGSTGPYTLSKVGIGTTNHSHVLQVENTSQFEPSGYYYSESPTTIGVNTTRISGIRTTYSDNSPTVIPGMLVLGPSNVITSGTTITSIFPPNIIEISNATLNTSVQTGVALSFRFPSQKSIFTITEDGNVGIGTNIPAAYSVWNTLTLDSGKRSSNGLRGGGDLVLASNGRPYVDLFTIDYSHPVSMGYSGYTNVPLTRVTEMICSEPFEIYGPLLVLDQTVKVGIGSTNPSSKVQVVGGDVRVGLNTSEGLILTSPNGTKFRLVVDDSGNLTTTVVL